MKNKILVVEDEIITAMELKDILLGLGYEVLAVVDNGKDAIEKSELLCPDLIIMDIRIKGDMDGITAAKKINENQNIPIIYLTAYSDETTFQRAKLTEPYGFIVKPFEERDIRIAIETSLQKYKNEKRRLNIKNFIIESSINPIVQFDTDGNISYVNQSFFKCFGYSEKDIISKFNFVDLFETEENGLETLEKLLKQGKCFGEITAKRKDKTKFFAQISANLVKDDEENVLSMTAGFTDITKKKESEQETLRTKDFLQNIIDSTSEIIISIDKENLITTWNKTAEFIIGYKSREMVGKNIEKLDLFFNPQEIMDMIKEVSSGEKNHFNEISLKTKDGSKKLIGLSYSPITGRNNEQSGVLLTGRDKTHDKKHHGRLLTGSSYIITERESLPAINLFLDLTISGKNGLLITRGNVNKIKSIVHSPNVEIYVLDENSVQGFKNIPDLDKLIQVIKKYSNKKDSIILLDRIDYLLMNFSFEEIIKTLYKINNIIASNKSLFLLHINPMILDPRKLAIFEDEFQILPSQKIEEILIEDEIYKILRFIHDKNKNNLEVSLKKIRQHFSIAYPTISKRVKALEDNGLIIIKLQGRKKTLHTSEKGKNLLQKMQIL